MFSQHVMSSESINQGESLPGASAGEQARHQPVGGEPFIALCITSLINSNYFILVFAFFFGPVKLSLSETSDFILHPPIHPAVVRQRVIEELNCLPCYTMCQGEMLDFCGCLQGKMLKSSGNFFFFLMRKGKGSKNLLRIVASGL